MRRIVLASTSRYRAELLGRLGVPFEAVAPGVDESGLDLPPRELAAALAAAKARAVAERDGDAIVIGSDQVASIDGDVLGKPGTVERAQAQLARLSGRTHELITGVCVVDARTGGRLDHLDVHTMTLRPLSHAEIADYVGRDRPLDCAGAYKIEGLGIALMAAIEGDDFTAITGLPLIAVTRMLGALGAEVLGR